MAIAPRLAIRIGGYNQVIRQLPLGVVLLILCAASFNGTPQGGGNRITQTPEIKLQVIPTHYTYTLPERVFIKVQLTNISGKNLCFPKPGLEEETPENGYLSTQTVSLDGHEYEHMFNRLCGGTPWPKEKLMLDIKQRWIKLARNEVYITEPVKIADDLKRNGRYRLITTYHPMEASFESQVKFRAYVESAARDAGCVVPWTEAFADPVLITVVAPPKR